MVSGFPTLARHLAHESHDDLGLGCPAVRSVELGVWSSSSRACLRFCLFGRESSPGEDKPAAPDSLPSPQHVAREKGAGVILVRFDSRARRAKPPTVVEAVTKLGSRLLVHRGQSRATAHK
jgi:hypothetical protein